MGKKVSKIKRSESEIDNTNCRRTKSLQQIKEEESIQIKSFTQEMPKADFKIYSQIFKSQDEIQQVRKSYKILAEEDEEIIQEIKNDIKIKRAYSQIQCQPFWIKIYPKNENNEKLFYNELKILRNLSHPNIIRVLDYFQDQFNFYTVFQNFPGIPIMQYICQMHDQLSYEQILIIVSDLFNAVDYIHSKKVALRNLDINNLYYDGRSVMICNFEYAYFYLVNLEENQKRSSKKNLLKFKELYVPQILAPPEFRLNKYYSYEIDFWLLGTILLFFCKEKPQKLSKKTFKTREKMIQHFIKKEDQKKFQDFMDDNVIFQHKTFDNLIIILLDQKPQKRIDKLQTFSLNTQLQIKRKTNQEVLLQLQNYVSKFLTQKLFYKPLKIFYVNKLMTYQEQFQIVQIIECMDLDRNALLTKKEFTKGLKYASPETSLSKIKKIYDILDINNNDYIEMWEFCIGFTMDSFIAKEEQLERIYGFLQLHSESPLTLDSMNKLLEIDTKEFFL